MPGPQITVALLARPEWLDLPSENPAPADPRIWSAPLQVLVLERDPSDRLLSELRAFVSQGPSAVWVVMTSPASVIAFTHWTADRSLPWEASLTQFAAVGSGTVEQMRRSGIGSENTVVVGGDASSADALTTVDVIAAHLEKEGASWQDQFFVVVGGKDNRPTLCDALRRQKAQVMALPIYTRQDVEWPESIWTRLKARPQETAIVITSSTVIDRLHKALVTHQIDPGSLNWATHHATIAARLKTQGLSPIRRVRLDPLALSVDLFEHEQHW